MISKSLITVGNRHREEMFWPFIDKIIQIGYLVILF